MVTALVPYIGYERSAAMAKEALETGRGVYELVLEKEWLSDEKLDEILTPEAMTQPRAMPHAVEQRADRYGSDDGTYITSGRTVRGTSGREDFRRSDPATPATTIRGTATEARRG